jgi:hypothetical protein
MDHVASIIHITDLHLALYAGGSPGSPRRRAFLSHLASSIIDLAGRAELMEGHDPAAWAYLSEGLEQAVAAERSALVDGGKVALIQSGDVTAHGLSTAKGPHRFATWEQYGELRAGLQPHVDGWVDVYGNHDVWADGVPGPSKASIRAMDEALPNTSDWADCPVVLDLPNGDRLEIYRLNTVTESWRHGAAAQGRVGSHLPGSDVSTALQDLVTLAGQQPVAAGGGSSIRVLATHHPPHPFRTTNAKRRTTAHLHGCKDLAGALKDRFSIVVAGHRHLDDPDIDATTGGTQAPLEPGTAQLVAFTTAQDLTGGLRGDYMAHGPDLAGALPETSEEGASIVEDDERNAFSIYRLWSGDGLLAIYRLRYVFEEEVELGEDPGFRLSPSSAFTVPPRASLPLFGPSGIP